MTISVLGRLMRRTVRDSRSGCLRWTGCHNSRDYGCISVAGEVQLAHRVSYELHVGPIPDGMQIDHVRARGCVYKDCVEPAHLEPVTARENNHRQTGVHKTRCVHGHELTPGNTVIKRRRNGHEIRNCRECANAQSRARYLVAAARVGTLDTGGLA